MAIDRDPSAITAGRAVEYASNGRLMLVEGRFGDLADFAREHGFAPADAIVLDIGVSSMQLDEAERGFSFRADGPLDMRMEQKGESAADTEIMPVIPSPASKWGPTKSLPLLR